MGAPPPPGLSRRMAGPAAEPAGPVQARKATRARFRSPPNGRAGGRGTRHRAPVRVWAQGAPLRDRDRTVSDKISIAEARARRSDPVWRRRHKLADLTGMGLVVLLLLLPPLAGLVWRPLGVAVVAALLLGAPVSIWYRGPAVGLERRAALLVAVPVLNLFVLVPAVWRFAHLGIQRWQGPLEPPWDDATWWIAGVVGVALWVASLAGLALSLGA